MRTNLFLLSVMDNVSQNMDSWSCFLPLYLTSGYQHIPVLNWHECITPLLYRLGIWRTLVKPFGLIDDPEAFGKMMDEIFKELLIAKQDLDDSTVLAEDYAVYIMEIDVSWNNINFTKKLNMKICTVPNSIVQTSKHFLPKRSRERPLQVYRSTETASTLLLNGIADFGPAS